MITNQIKQEILQTLLEKTGSIDWTINGPEIDARECVIYKATNKGSPEAIAIKVYKEEQQRKPTEQYNALKTYSELLNKDGYYVPKIFGKLKNKSIFLMAWVDSPTLEKRLWRFFYSRKHVQSDIRRSFTWLKEFHQHAKLDIAVVNIEKYKKNLDRFFDKHEGNILLSDNIIFKEGKRHFDSLCLEYSGLKTQHANIHRDFTPSNILIDDNKVTSIDMYCNQYLPTSNDIASLFTYIAIEYPNMLTRQDFKHPPSKWPLFKLILEAYEYPKAPIQINFLLFVFLYQLLRRWTVIKHRNNKHSSLLDRWRLRNLEMIVDNLSKTLREIHNLS